MFSWWMWIIIFAKYLQFDEYVYIYGDARQSMKHVHFESTEIILKAKSVSKSVWN